MFSRHSTLDGTLAAVICVVPLAAMPSSCRLASCAAASVCRCAAIVSGLSPPTFWGSCGLYGTSAMDTGSLLGLYPGGGSTYPLGRPMFICRPATSILSRFRAQVAISSVLNSTKPNFWLASMLTLMTGSPCSTQCGSACAISTLNRSLSTSIVVTPAIRLPT